jgi:hypothetical protein
MRVMDGGELRTDRYIPLHPQLKEMLDEWVANRPAANPREDARGINERRALPRR